MVAMGPSQAAATGISLSGPRARMHVWFMRVCPGIVVCTSLIQLLAVGHPWRRLRLPYASVGRGGASSSSSSFLGAWNPTRFFVGLGGGDVALPNLSIQTQEPPHAPPLQLPSNKIGPIMLVLRQDIQRNIKVRKEMLLDPEDLHQFQNHSSQMVALDCMVSIASDVFICTYDGNMGKVVEGHRRYLVFKKSILLDCRKLVEFVDLHENKMLSWDDFVPAVRQAHEGRSGQPACWKVVIHKPKEEGYFYANPTLMSA